MADGVITQIQLPNGEIYNIGSGGSSGIEVELVSSYNESNQEVTLFIQPITDQTYKIIN